MRQRDGSALEKVAGYVVGGISEIGVLAVFFGRDYLGLSQVQALLLSFALFSVGIELLLWASGNAGPIGWLLGRLLGRPRTTAGAAWNMVATHVAGTACEVAVLAIFFGRADLHLTLLQATALAASMFWLGLELLLHANGHRGPLVASLAFVGRGIVVVLEWGSRPLEDENGEPAVYHRSSAFIAVPVVALILTIAIPIRWCVRRLLRRSPSWTTEDEWPTLSEVWRSVPVEMLGNPIHKPFARIELPERLPPANLAMSQQGEISGASCP